MVNVGVAAFERRYDCVLHGAHDPKRQFDHCGWKDQYFTIRYLLPHYKK
jgi:hypothetical protein